MAKRIPIVDDEGPIVEFIARPFGLDELVGAVRRVPGDS